MTPSVSIIQQKWLSICGTVYYINSNLLKSIKCILIRIYFHDSDDDDTHKGFEVWNKDNEEEWQQHKRLSFETYMKYDDYIWT